MAKTCAAIELFLNRLSLHSVLEEDEREIIRSLPCHLKEVKANREFVRLGEITHEACLLVDGLSARFGQTAEGERQITAVYVAGDIPDLCSVMLPQSATGLQSLSTTILMTIPHEAIRRAAENPAINHALWRDNLVDVGIANEWLVNVGRRDALARIAHLVCEIATRTSATATAFRFSLPLTQQNLADATGISPVHVNRVLRQLREMGLLSHTAHMAHVHDWAGLKSVGDFDSVYLYRARETSQFDVLHRTSQHIGA